MFLTSSTGRNLGVTMALCEVFWCLYILHFLYGECFLQILVSKKVCVLFFWPCLHHSMKNIFLNIVIGIAKENTLKKYQTSSKQMYMTGVYTLVMFLEPIVLMILSKCICLVYMLTNIQILTLTWFTADMKSNQSFPKSKNVKTKLKQFQ